MRIVIECAWCHKVIGIKEGEKWEAVLTPVTHSICKTCHQTIALNAEAMQAGEQAAALSNPN
jgi:hypothetical protein